MILIIGFLISFAQSNLTEEQRKNLRKKVTKPLSAFYGNDPADPDFAVFAVGCSLC